MKAHHLLAFIALLSIVPASYASDLEKEKRWSEQITNAILVGEAQWLEDQQGKFLTIYSESNRSHVKGAVIILHGMGAHPDWQDVIYPLRTRLPDAGWATLSIQMPILPNSANQTEYLPLFDEVQPRIQAAINFLEQQKQGPIILLGHSLGATMGAHYLANTPKNKIQAFIAIGMSSSDTDPKFNNAEHLAKINIAILDLYGSQDLDGVLDSAKKRKSAAKKGANRAYRQIKVEGADHMFNGLDDELLQITGSWLHKVIRNQR
ncbi:MAG: alpha/beta fold hydrolase [Gammaproteobacteria bacterium]|nr:alpha/beta fold hydrolase [Gammaproteobacteria bacterium]